MFDAATSANPNTSGWATEKVTFSLEPRALSVWDATTHAWTVAKGNFTIFVGRHAADPEMLSAKLPSM